MNEKAKEINDTELNYYPVTESENNNKSDVINGLVTLGWNISAAYCSIYQGETFHHTLMVRNTPKQPAQKENPVVSDPLDLLIKAYNDEIELAKNIIDDNGSDNIQFWKGRLNAMYIAKLWIENLKD